MRKTQLFLLHYAGGNTHSFSFLKPWLKQFEVISPELPGRGRRSDERLLYNFSQAAEDIYFQVERTLVPGNFMIYGHSMGAYLALKVASMLQTAGKPPVYLIVSGNPGPRKHGRPQLKYRLEREAFKQELRMMGGIPDEVLDNKEMFDHFEPILRADFEIAEKNGMEEDGPVDVPLFALMGDDEPGKEDITNWSRYTRNVFRHELFPGGHFFIYRHPERLASIISECYRKVTAALW
ncbi:MAG: thioesterase [Bacteroidetes bacterium]|nr:thioesterase [Bacteroidota bacterium]